VAYSIAAEAKSLPIFGEIITRLAGRLTPAAIVAVQKMAFTDPSLYAAVMMSLSSVVRPA
jgi:hypothetical protein